MPDRKLFADEIESRLDALLLLALRQRSATLAAQGLEPLPRSVQERVLHWVAVAAQSSTELGLMLATGAAPHQEELDDWVLAGLNAFDVGGVSAAESAWDGFAEQFKSRRWRHGVSVVTTFAAMESRLARLLQALCGRPLTLAIGPMPLTDTETLWLPAQIEVFDTAEANAGLYTVMTAMLWAQIRFGTFSIDPEPALAACSDRQSTLDRLALFEAMRLEARIAAELPGLGAQIARLRGPWPLELVAAAAELALPEATVTDSLRHALTAQGVAATVNLPYRFALHFARTQQRQSARSVQAAKLVKRALNVIRGAGGRGQENPEFPPMAAEGDGAAADPQADLVSLPADATATGENKDAASDERPPQGLSPAGQGVWQPVNAAGAESALAAERAPDALYDEWDYRRQAWRRDWCHLYETDSAAGDLAWVQQTRQRNAHLIRNIRRRFESLRGEDRIHRRQLEGEDLDLDAQVEAHADRKSGVVPSPRLFCHRRRSERSLAVMFMVDMSGSTKGWINDAERESLVLLCEAIEALGDRYAIYGFSGWTRTRCDIYRVKEFAARYDATTQARIAGIEAKDYTRMGVAVRHLSTLLAAQPARHKLLVTLSDGRPDDYGDEYRGHYGIEDTRRALHEARARGIRSYCVTIDRHGADYLPQLYGPAHYTVIDDAKKLPQQLAEIYRKLTS